MARADTASWQMNFTGRGYGHGIGMSQYGAYGQALQGSAYRAILRHYYTGISFGAASNSLVRVLVSDGRTSVSVACPAAYEASVGSATVSLAAGSSAIVTWTGSAYRLTAGTRTWTTSAPIVFRPTSQLLALATASGVYKAGSISYRGTLTVARWSGKLAAINTLPLESYLRGVVPLEMPSSWPAEALKAQAVAARTYAVRSRVGGELFDLYCDTRSQSYGGASHETASTNAAVSGTAGVTATYAGQPIAAFYFSTSGGHTENIEHVWETSAQPYLKGVPDPCDDLSPYHVWPENPIRRSASAVAAALGDGALPAGQLETLCPVELGVSGRIKKAIAVSEAGATALSGSAIRTALGLRSTWFDVRSMSISSAGISTIAEGERLTLTGTTYPALSAEATLKLCYYRDGRWSSVVVPSSAISSGTRSVTAGGLTASCSYSTYRYTIKPPATTTYYFAVGSSRSPQASVRVDASPLTIDAVALTPAALARLADGSREHCQIRYTISEGATTRVTIRSLADGKRLRTVSNYRAVAAGPQTVTWDGTIEWAGRRIPAPDGYYRVLVEGEDAAGTRATQRVVLRCQSDLARWGTGATCVTQTTRSFSIRRGRRATFGFIALYAPPVGEAASFSQARLVLKIRDSQGRSRYTRILPSMALNVLHSTSISRCYLARGTYRYYVLARLPDGTRQQMSSIRVMRIL